MHTTLDIEDDVLAALAGSSEGDRPATTGIAGFRAFDAANLQLVTNEQIDQLRDQDGL